MSKITNGYCKRGLVTTAAMAVLVGATFSPAALAAENLGADAATIPPVRMASAFADASSAETYPDGAYTAQVDAPGGPVEFSMQVENGLVVGIGVVPTEGAVPADVFVNGFYRCFDPAAELYPDVTVSFADGVYTGYVGGDESAPYISITVESGNVVEFMVSTWLPPADIVDCLQRLVPSVDSMLELTYNGNQYALYELPMTWVEASEFCEQMGGHLVTITSAEEQEFIEGFISRGMMGQYWIGLVPQGSGYAWVTGEAVGFSNYADAPAGAGGTSADEQLYGQISNVVNGDVPLFSWTFVPANNVVATSSFHGPDTVGFVCEWDAESQAPAGSETGDGAETADTGDTGDTTEAAGTGDATEATDTGGETQPTGTGSETQPTSTGDATETAGASETTETADTGETTEATGTGDATETAGTSDATEASGEQQGGGSAGGFQSAFFTGTEDSSEQGTVDEDAQTEGGDAQSTKGTSDSTGTESTQTTDTSTQQPAAAEIEDAITVSGEGTQTIDGIKLAPGAYRVTIESTEESIDATVTIGDSAYYLYDSATIVNRFISVVDQADASVSVENNGSWTVTFEPITMASGLVMSGTGSFISDYVYLEEEAVVRFEITNNGDWDTWATISSICPTWSDGTWDSSSSSTTYSVPSGESGSILFVVRPRNGVCVIQISCKSTIDWTITPVSVVDDGFDPAAEAAEEHNAALASRATGGEQGGSATTTEGEQGDGGSSTEQASAGAESVTGLWLLSSIQVDGSDMTEEQADEYFAASGYTGMLFAYDNGLCSILIVPGKDAELVDSYGTWEMSDDGALTFVLDDVGHEASVVDGKLYLKISGGTLVFSKS